MCMGDKEKTRNNLRDDDHLVCCEVCNHIDENINMIYCECMYFCNIDCLADNYDLSDEVIKIIKEIK